MKTKFLVMGIFLISHVSIGFVSIKLTEQCAKILKIICRTTVNNKTVPYIVHFRPEEVYVARIIENGSVDSSTVFVVKSNKEIEEIAGVIDYKKNGEIEWAKALFETSSKARSEIQQMVKQ